MSKDSRDGFDSLFEPFNPGTEPPEGEPRVYPTHETPEVGATMRTDQHPQAAAPAAMGQVYCASCGRPNDGANRHCE